MKGIFDCYGKEITLGSIVKRVMIDRTGVAETDYFVYKRAQDHPNRYLFIYDIEGRIRKDNLMNCIVDDSVTLINGDHGKWYLLGREEEVHGKLFKR